MPLNYTATYDPTTDIGAVRATIQDIAVNQAAGDTLPSPTVARSQWSVLFVDQEIQIKLDLHAGAINQHDLAAADLLEDIASNAALLSKLTRLGSYISDTRKTAEDLRQQADALRARYGKGVMSGVEEPAEAISEEIWTDFDWRRSIWETIPRG